MIMTIKKEHPKFLVPNYGAKSRKGVKERWRAQRGIDSKKRIKRSGYGASPSIGYKNSSDVRFARPDGNWPVVVHNEKELLALSNVQNRIAVFAHSLSIRKRTILQKVADANKIKVANRARK